MTSFEFRKGAATDFLATGVLATLLTVCTLGLGTPWAVVLFHQWQCKHTYVNGHQLQFIGTGTDLFGKFIIWTLLTIVTLGLFTFIWYPRYVKWVTEHTDYFRG